MRAANARGFSLIELLIAIIIFGIVGSSIFGLLARTQRLSRTQADRATMQANIRAGMGLVTSELRELSVSGTQADIQSLTTTNITYRGMRGLGFVCDVDANFIRVQDSTFSGYRVPIPNWDRVMLFVENDPDIATDDGWLERTITGVTAENCSAGGLGIRLDFGTSLPTSPDTLSMITVGSPLRTFELMEIGELVQGGETWLGGRSISGGQTFQPVLGPLAPNGVQFGFRTALGATTTNPLTVRVVTLTLIGITDHIVIAGAGSTPGVRDTEQLVTTIQLRNAP